jgi:hypothetical protein
MSNRRNDDVTAPVPAALEAELSALARTAEDLPDLDGLFAGLQSRVARERGPRAWLRSRSTPVRLGIALGAAVALASPAAFGIVRPDIAVYPAGRMALALLSIGALLVLSLVLALRPLQRSTLADPLGRAAVGAALLWLCGLYLLPAAHNAHAASVSPTGLAPAFGRALPCMVIGLLLGLPFLALLASLGRGGVRRGVLLAVTAGLLANFLLQLLCPVTAPLHMLLGHLGVAVLLLAGALGFDRARA